MPDDATSADEHAGATIAVMVDGPLLVTGAFTITDADGNVIDAPAGRAKLCRCGRSATKPFCDATHKRTGWRADE